VWFAPTSIDMTKSGSASWMRLIVEPKLDSESGINSSPRTSASFSSASTFTQSADSWPKL